MAYDLCARIGARVAFNIAEHFENVTIPILEVCIYQLEKIKKQLEALKTKEN